MNGKSVLVAVAIASMTLHCGTSPGSPSRSVVGDSPLNAGIYQGLSSCQFTLECSSGGFSEDTSDSFDTFTVSENGIPLDQGAEIRVGQTNSATDLFDLFDVECSVVEVVETGDGVVVDYEGTLTILDWFGTTLDLDGFATVTYRAGESSQIDLTSASFFGGVDAFGDFVSLDIECAGEFTR